MNIFTKSKLLIATLAISSMASAQTLTGGVRLGVNLSTLSGIENTSQNITKAKQKMSPAGGIFFRYDANKKWAISMDLLYSPKGATYSGNDSVKTDSRIGTGTYEYNDVLNYIEIPILVHYKFLGNESKFRPYVSLGIAGAVRYSGKTNLDYTFNGKVNGSKNDTTITAKPELNNYYQRGNIDYGVVGGAGFTYDISKKLGLGVDARFTKGLVDLRENKIEDMAIKNTAISVWLTVAFKLWEDK